MLSNLETEPTANYILCADFGSTYTKLTTVDPVKREIIATSKAFTTITTHILEGFNNALVELERNVGKLAYSKFLAASSAAGGLKMVAVGLVPSLTANAAKMAASSAGAKLIATYSYELSQAEVDAIEAAKPDIILLSGGIDGGNKEVICHNATMLAKLSHDVPIIIAGNKSMAEQVRQIIISGGKQAIIVENVMPRFGELNIMPAKLAIRDLFISNIISAKGLDDAQAMVSGEIIPTPLAVFEACELLSTVGPLVAVDVGGATTDVYSMTDGVPTRPNTIEKGLKEPFAKRSVEGDLGVRYSIPSLVSEAGLAKIAQGCGLSEAEVEGWLATCQNDTSTVATRDSDGATIDDELAASCIEISMVRHAGSLESVYTPMGEMMIQTGKDLGDVEFLIGSGGSVINSPNAEQILQRALASLTDPFSLKPRAPRIIIDRQNILTAMGLLSRVDKEAALAIMRQQFGMS